MNIELLLMGSLTILLDILIIEVILMFGKFLIDEWRSDDDI